MNDFRDSVPGNSMPRLLSEAAHEVYLSITQSGGRAKTEEHEDSRAQIAELIEFGLLVPESDDPSIVAAVDPKVISTSLSTAWQREAAQLLSRSAALAGELRSLDEAFGELRGQGQTDGKIEYVHGGPAINQRLAVLIDNCSQELLTAQPGGGRGSEVVRGAISRDLGVLQRGGTTRSIYQPSARYSSPTLEYVETMTTAGSQIRTLDEPFTILIIIDRRVAVIPGSQDKSQAAFVSDQAVVSYLVQYFESLWGRALPFQASREVPPVVLSSLRRQIIRSMSRGVGHRVIARNLGLSERTLARHIAEMREDYGVDTLFQLGWKLAQEAEQIQSDEEEETPDSPAVT
ncbi:hypothetical protein [Kitasatospora phosalacinea]|uniref:HTH luxR-type domain-containing protein n=1 Tax=Kitasatospora phosalacinea TaxID=2065 RepID=A0ABW6GVR6_9ACTN